MEVKAQCPYANCSGPYEDQVTYNGCVYFYEYCLCINQYNYHEVVLTNIIVSDDNGCTTLDFENNKGAITDAILLDIAASGILYTVWGLTIPDCPNDLCLVRWRDAICYSGWYEVPPTGDPDDPHGWGMIKCDNEVRSCGETIRICWEVINGRRQLTIWRRGYMYPSCPNPPPECKNNCD